MAALLTAAAAIAAGGAVAVRRRRRGPTPSDQPAPVVPGPPSRAPVTETVEQTWSCECGQAYRVQGEDRHRIYWLADATVSDPMLSSQCANCDRALPREHDTPSADPA